MAGLNETRYAEEAGELIVELGQSIKCLAKCDRFGWFNHHPDNPMVTNLEALADSLKQVNEEIMDCNGAIKTLSARMLGILEMEAEAPRVEETRKKLQELIDNVP